MTQALLPSAGFRMQRRRSSLERPLQRDILRWAKAAHIPAASPGQQIRSRHGAKLISASAGLPDVLLWMPWGQQFAIEVKRQDGKGALREDQARWILATVRDAPWTGVIVADALEDVTGALDPMLKAWRDCLYGVGVFWWRVVEAADAPWRTAQAGAIAAAQRRCARS